MTVLGVREDAERRRVQVEELLFSFLASFSLCGRISGDNFEFRILNFEV